MIKAQDIQFWQIRKRANRRKPYEVRWRVDAAAFSRSYLTKALAETYRSSLVGAAREGEVFSLTTGEPVSWARSAETVYSHARAFVAMRWAEASDNTRAALVRSLVPIVLATLEGKKAKRGRPEEKTLRRALSMYALRPGAWASPDGQICDMPDDIRAALAWLAAVSRPVTALEDRAALRELLGALALRLDGERLAHTSMRNRRAVLHALLDYADERGLLSGNPLTGVKTKRRRASDAIDPRRVPSLAQARAVLAAVSDVRGGGHLAAFFDVLYYAGTRPGEARALHEHDCSLPPTGWGSLLLAGNRPEVAAAWTDDGARHRERELKHRAPGEVRPVPIPPVLVASLRTHIERYGTAPDGRLFWENAETFAPVTGQTYRRVWQRARVLGLSGPDRASKLADRPYDLRHGNASLLLASGVPATEVARRLGHSVQMLYTTYAHWFDGMEDAANAAVDAALANLDALTCENPGAGPDTGQNEGHGTA
ncbi:tyrosine-type recombinase/integrase [Spirillospora sp. NBC_01491]|uniref:tyrosine-type recombinase/integrase n=1 Tax=Spirillospora sp. NBC_01491 TaxID=2976007 RepID=UPI002E2F8D7C|nr:tyrosine-type recombinase/integrase [Spirillospora sp. NBC_01491]